jgi:hypothetical protein
MSLVKRMFGKPVFVGSLIVAALLVPRVALGQATRTWVSGVGDDANPCSRTAPCKTFAGAISKTAVGGEIDVLDPGGFGAVTITKSISIEADGVIAGVLVSGTSGIVVNASSNSVVVIRGLTFEGDGTGLSGVNFISGGALFIEHCWINNFTQPGINFHPNSPAFLSVKDTVVRNCPGGGVEITGASGGSAQASLVGVKSEGNLFGFRVENGGRASATDCVAAMNQNNGFVVNTPSGVGELDLERCFSVDNGRSGASAVAGVQSVGPAGTVRIGTTVVTNNPVGLLSTSSGQILSYGNNSITGNTISDGGPTGSLLLH